MTKNDDILFSYSNQQALDDGWFADVTPDGMKTKGWQWIVTCTVYEEISLAAIAEFFNEMVGCYNKTHDTFMTSFMNDSKYCLMLEFETDKPKIFKVCKPDDF